MQICYDVWEQQPIGFVLIPMGKHKPTDKLFSTLLASIKEVHSKTGEADHCGLQLPNSVCCLLITAGFVLTFPKPF